MQNNLDKNYHLQVKLPHGNWINIKNFKDDDNTFTVSSDGKMLATESNISKVKEYHPEYEYRAEKNTSFNEGSDNLYVTL